MSVTWFVAEPTFDSVEILVLFLFILFRFGLLAVPVAVVSVVVGEAPTLPLGLSFVAIIPKGVNADLSFLLRHFVILFNSKLCLNREN